MQYRSLTQLIGDKLRKQIYDGKYQPGSRLNISDIAQNLSVSPVPVREALRNLETEGLVVFKNNRGVDVRALSVEDVRELYLIRTPLECLAAVEAAKKARPADIKGLKELIDKLDKLDDAIQWHRLHAEFHQRLYALSGMRRLERIIDILRVQMQPYSRSYMSNAHHLKMAQKEHREMLECLSKHDTKTMEGVVRKHLARPADLAINAVGSGMTLT